MFYVFFFVNSSKKSLEVLVFCLVIGVIVEMGFVCLDQSVIIKKGLYMCWDKKLFVLYQINILKDRNGWICYYYYYYIFCLNKYLFFQGRECK